MARLRCIRGCAEKQASVSLEAEINKREESTMKVSSKDDDLFLPLPEMPLPLSNIDRRAFLMRNAAIGAAAVMTGTVWTAEARAQQAAKEAAAPPLGATLSRRFRSSPPLRQ